MRSKIAPRVGSPSAGKRDRAGSMVQVGLRALHDDDPEGAREVLSILGLAVPRFPSLKELAYAGAIFDYSGEMFPHPRWEMDSTM